MKTTRRQNTAALLIVFAVAVTLGVILSLRQGSATNLESLVTPVDVSDADLRCYMRRSGAATAQAKNDVKRARMLWFTDWWKKGLVVHCPRTTGTPQDLTDDEATRYLHGYLDLKQKFGNDLQATKKHWKELGYKEGRIIPAVPVPIENRIISIKSALSDKFCGTTVFTHDVKCDKSSVTDTERYLLEKVGKDLMVLKGYASNKYCASVPGRGLVCDRNTVSEAENFLYKVYGHSALAFKSAKSKLFCGSTNWQIICNDATPGLGQFFTWKVEVPVSAPSTTATTSSPGTIQPSSAATSTTAVTQTLTKEQERFNNAFAECARTRSEAECTQLMGTQPAAPTFVTQSAAPTAVTKTLTTEQERHNNAFAECAKTRSEAECTQLMGPPVTQTTAATFVTQSAVPTAATQTLTKEQERFNNAFAECARTRSEGECAQIMGSPAAFLKNAIAAAKETAAASHLSAENAAKLAKTSASNAEQALKDAKAASVAACAASKKTTENLKLKINGNLTKFETLQLDILAANASQTASKALAIVVQAESAVKDAQAHATEASSAAQKALASHKVVEDVIVSTKTLVEASHQTTATKAAELAVQFANEAETALYKARNAEQRALGNTTSMAIMQSDQKTLEQQAIVDAAKKAEEAKKVEAQPPATNAANAAVVKTSGGVKSLTDRFINAANSGSVDVNKVTEVVVTTAKAVAEVASSVATNTAAVEKENVQKTTTAVVANNNALDTNAKAIGNTVDAVKAANSVVLETKDMEGAKNNVKAASDTAIAATGNAEAAVQNAKSAAGNATTAKKEGTAAEAEAAAKAAEDAKKVALEAKAKADAATKASQDAQKVIVEVAKEVVKETTTTYTPISKLDVATREQARATLVQEEAKALLDKQMASEAAKALKALVDKQVRDKQASDAAAKSKIVITSSNNNNSILAILVAGMVGTYALYRYRRYSQQ